jgi:hypothetical protein
MKIQPNPRTLTAILLAACCASLQSPASALTSFPQEVVLESAKRPRAVPMILHLTSGTKLRVRAVQIGDNWEIKNKDGFSKLPATRVERAVQELTLLKEARKLERDASRKKPIQRAAYAEWLAGEGLAIEALKELDRLLKADPEFQAARSVIARQKFSLGLPKLNAQSSAKEIQALAGVARRFGPAGQEAAAQQISRLEPNAQLQSALLQELVSKDAKRRGFAALSLRRAAPGLHAQALLQRAVLDRSSEVRDSAALSLAAFKNPQLVVPVLNAMNSKSSTVRLNASATLGSMGYKAAVAPLIARLSKLSTLKAGGDGGGGFGGHFFAGKQVAYIQDFDVEVAAGSSIADPVINVLTEGVVLDVKIHSVTERGVARERSSIYQSLAKLTGASPGRTTKNWMSWWDKNKLAYLPKEAPEATSSTSRDL